MPKIRVKVLRNIAKAPNIVEITKGRRKLKVIIESDDIISFSGSRSLMPSVAEILQMSYPFDAPHISRPIWHDRNPRLFHTDYTATRTPHLVIQRRAYQVPENRMAIIESLTTKIQRITAATVLGIVETYWALYKSDGSAPYNINYSMLMSNTVGAHDQQETGGILLLRGDEIRNYTLDRSADGTVRFGNIYKITEFDV